MGDFKNTNLHISQLNKYIIKIFTYQNHRHHLTLPLLAALQLFVNQFFYFFGPVSIFHSNLSLNRNLQNFQINQSFYHCHAYHCNNHHLHYYHLYHFYFYLIDMIWDDYLNRTIKILYFEQNLWYHLIQHLVVHRPCVGVADYSCLKMKKKLNLILFKEFLKP